ncbi:MAG: hypothetical protein ACXADW_02795 [Candidatus Hodarchaeales archaeon]
MIEKKFDRGLYEKYDDLAKSHAKQAFKKVRYKVREHPDRHAVDLIVSRGEKVFYVETEIKLELDKGNWKWPDIRIPWRKRKFCGLDRPTLFILFSKKGDKFFCFWDNVVTKDKIKEIKNKYFQGGGEYFFLIPMSETFNDIKSALKNIPN